MVDHVGEDLVERSLGLPADRGGDLLDRRDAVEHVLDPLSVDAVVLDVLELRRRAGRGDHALGEVDDPDPLLRADVVDLARGGLLAHQADQRAHGVLDVAEAARLVPVAVDFQWAVGERPLDEARDHHPVHPALARADRVEEPNDHGVEAALLVVGEREELVHRLRVGVRPPARRGRAVDPPRGLGERQLLAVVAVDLRGRGDEHALAEPVAVLEHGLGSAEVRDEGVHRLLDDQPHADRRREVVDDIALVHELVDDRRLQDGVDDQVEVAPAVQVLDVLKRPGGEVVEGVDLPALVEEAFAEMGADEPGAAGDERFPAHGGQA